MVSRGAGGRTPEGVAVSCCAAMAPAGRVFRISALAQAVPGGRCGARSSRESSGRSRGARTPERLSVCLLQHRAALWREPRRMQPPGTPFPPGSTANRGASRSHHAGGPPERSECRSSGLTELRSSRRRAALRARPGARTRSGRVRAAGARSPREEGLGRRWCWSLRRISKLIPQQNVPT